MPLRRFLVPFALGLCSILALISCQLSAPRERPAEEVLRRAIINNALLDHVGIDARLRVSSDVLSGSLALRGGIDGGGVSWWGTGDLRMTHSTNTERSSFSGALTVLSLDHRTLGVRIDSAQGILADRLLSSIVHSDSAPWLMITFSTGSVALPVRSHVDAETVDALLSTLRIVSASPLTKQSLNSYIYTISVVTNPISANSHESWKGDLIIDAKTFELISVHWTMVDPKPSSSLSMNEVEVHFESRIQSPKPRVEGAVVPLTVQSLTDIILRKPLVP